MPKPGTPTSTVGSRLGPPPVVPAIPQINTALADYLRRLGLWAQGNFNSCLQKRSASGQFFLQSATGATVWAVSVDDSGVLHTTQMNPGERNP